MLGMHLSANCGLYSLCSDYWLQPAKVETGAYVYSSPSIPPDVSDVSCCTRGLANSQHACFSGCVMCDIPKPLLTHTIGVGLSTRDVVSGLR
jgi:hypothetical protein